MEPANESDFGNFHSLFTAATAAKEIVARTKYSPAAAWALFLLDWNEDVLQVLILRLVETAAWLVGLSDHLLLSTCVLSKCHWHRGQSRLIRGLLIFQVFLHH